MLLNMLINPNMMGITGGVSHDDFIKNAQHVGMQKNNGIKSKNEEVEEHQISDSSSILLNDEIEETNDTNENKQADSTSQTENTDQAKSSAENKESKNSSSDSVKVDLSSTAPATGELDFNEGTTIGSNLVSDKAPNYESEDVASQEQYPQNYQQSENVAQQGQYQQNYAYQDVNPQGQYQQNYAYQDVNPQGQYIHRDNTNKIMLIKI